MALMGLYSFAFFQLQPDRSFPHVQVWNEQLAAASKLLAQQRKVRKEAQQQAIIDEASIEGALDREVGSVDSNTVAATNSTTATTTKRLRGGDPNKPQRTVTPLADALINVFIYFAILNMVRRGRLARQNATTTGAGGAGLASRAQRQQTRAQAAARQAGFSAWVERLNRQRLANGQPALSAESLQLVLRERELNDGQDYDGLLQFDEESGPAVEALLSTMGATQQEIERCPSRIVQVGDDLLATEEEGNSTTTALHVCAVCLEPYAAGQRVRTVPCFHSFHAACLDPWLSNKASCPVCKFPAIA